MIRLAQEGYYYEEERTEEYFNWLVNKVGGESAVHLLSILFEIDFYGVMPNDDNRVEEGTKLRSLFTKEKGLDPDYEWINCGTCTVLEVIIGLAGEIVLMCPEDDEYSLSRWFSELIDNLDFPNLESGSDKTAYRLYKNSVIDIVYKWLDRDYSADGRGGLFPMKNSLKDQRFVELWYQMNGYFIEKMGASGQ